MLLHFFPEPQYPPPGGQPPMQGENNSHFTHALILLICRSNSVDSGDNQ